MPKKNFDDLLAKMTPERRAKIARGALKIIAEMRLQEMRQAREVTQELMAEAFNVKQSGISKIEARDDMLISTLQKYVRALGGELMIAARFPDGDTRIKQFDSFWGDDPGTSQEGGRK